ncbi:ras GEF [Meira miltonrushii]|uniref:Ras GEF n=1 Tax=Meira miltonrushii TaxID=1280837 RepID=A0A316VCR8_9BASI|nr:ras GEF [Meira miltonrushii]PWN35429.1 ras GEF [Meira miltonrushii]
MSAPRTSIAPIESFADVETTNWNAVKLIAVKYGINLKSPEEIRASMRSHRRTASTQDITMNKTDDGEEEDLGLGTPFRILARTKADGRTVYHLTYRHQANVGSSAAAAMHETGQIFDTSGDTSRESNEADEAGYDPGMDSPSSSLRKQRKKQPSSRTLRVARSISAFRVLNGSNAGSSSATRSNDASAHREEEEMDQRMLAETSGSPRPDKLQRGDVLGAILGLRQGISAEDYSWTDGSPAISSPSKSSKGISNDDRRSAGRNASQDKPSLFSARPSDATWRSISPFGAPVLQRDRSASIRQEATDRWNRSPIPRMADMGQPLFSDMHQMFANSPTVEASPINKVDDNDAHSEVESISNEEADPAKIFDVLQNDSPHRQSVRSNASSTSSPVASTAGSAKRTRESSANSTDRSEASTSALPGDDPRFALWAVRNASEEDGTLVLCSRQGEVDVQPIDSPKTMSSPRHAGVPTRKRGSVRASISSNDTGDGSSGAGVSSKLLSPSPASNRKGGLEESQHSILYPKNGAFLIAASMPYIVAELTSHIDNRFMTDFFYTYRAFTSPRELLRLLKVRFQWTLTGSGSEKEEAKRKIVRVRTYVVIKYWLTNFFTFDFLPNRALRTDFTDWLNSSSQDPMLISRPADLAIIKNLKKIVRNLKAAYENVGIGGLLLADTTNTPRLPESNSHPEALAEAGSDPAVNLEIGEAGLEESYDAAALTKSPSDNSILQSAIGTPSLGSEPFRPVHTQHRAPPPLPTSQGAFSRAFLTTFSKLSRFTRHMNTRNSTNPLLNDGSGFSEGSYTEPKPCADLLFVKGGLESFLDYFDLHPSQSTNGKRHKRSQQAGQSSGDESQDHVSDGTTGPEEATPSLSSNQTRSTPASSFDLHRGSPITGSDKGTFGLGIRNGESSVDDDDEEVGIAITSEEINQLDLSDNEAPPHSASHLSATQDMLHHFQSDQTLRSAMKDEQSPTSMRIASRQGSDSREDNSFAMTQNRNYQSSNIVQIDDIDLSSDDEEDGMVRRALRRLPGARDLRMAQNVTELEGPIRQSFDSISSLGRVYAESRRSLASYYGNDQGYGSLEADLQSERDAQHITSVVTSEMLDPDEALRGYELVKGFRIEHLEESDEEETGDVEAALRRLEGVIDEDKQRERAKRVERMWERSQAQKSDEQRRKDDVKTSSLLQSYEAAAATDLPADSTTSVQADDERRDVETPAPTISTKRDTSRNGHSRRPSSVGTAHDAMRSRITETPLSARPATRKLTVAPVHRSFLLDYHSDVIAQQFSLIEVELFRAVAWQELVTGQWKVRHHRGQVLDWEAFYQSRARQRIEMQNQTTSSSDSGAQNQQLESSVEAITARFNLTCNWVASEIVMTSTIDARAAVVRKLIRVAWKCYHQSNFATLTQIILGLQSPWIERLRKTWARVGALEMRMLRDLKAFINPARNFKHLRNAMREMLIEGQMEELITSTGPPQMMKGSGAGTSNSQASRSGGIALNDGCIPFFGLFLSDLAVHDALPTFVEPSSPDADVNIDSTTGHLNKLADPNAFDHLNALPKGVKLSPLVNLYKYRILAMTVKSVLALQDRLDAFNFRADKDAYVKALKIRCLEAEQLTVISHMAEP